LLRSEPFVYLHTSLLFVEECTTGVHFSILFNICIDNEVQWPHDLCYKIENR